MIDNSVSSLHYNSKTKNSTRKTAAPLSVTRESTLRTHTQDTVHGEDRLIFLHEERERFDPPSSPHASR